MIQEIIVVEGKDDVAAVKKAVDCECIITHGHGFGDKLLEELKEYQKRRGLIVLTDPDYAGNRIRSKIREAIPEAKHAFIDQKSAIKGDDIGVENAEPEAILNALKKAHATLSERRNEFTHEDLYRYGLEGVSGSKERRIELCKKLGIGYGNSKTLLLRLNNFNIGRDEFEKICEGENGKTVFSKKN